MPRRKTLEEFKKEITLITNNEYCAIGDYTNNHTKTKFIHNNCGTEFETRPKDFINGKSRCPKCGYEKLKNMHLKSHEIFEKEFEKKSDGEYILLSEYINSQTKINIMHCKCKTIFEVTPNNFLSKSSGCPKCFGNIKKTTEVFKKEVKALEGAEYKVLEDYKGKNVKIKFFHMECGNVFMMSPDKFIQGHRCTKCRESKGEAKIRKVLIKYNLDFATQYRFNDCRREKYPLPFDFAVFKNSKLVFLIEYDGEQHFRPVNFNGIDNNRADEIFIMNKTRDSIKNDYCKNNDIKLVRIPYTEYDNIENIILSMATPSEA